MLRMSEVNEVDHQSMQHMLTEGAVNWDGFGKQIAQETNALLGSPESVLLFDESGFGKKGKSSAGVARQWNGRLGKVDNCQVGVFATLCRGEMASLIDTRLYLPEDWAHLLYLFACHHFLHLSRQQAPCIHPFRQTGWQ